MKKLTLIVLVGASLLGTAGIASAQYSVVRKMWAGRTIQETKSDCALRR